MCVCRLVFLPKVAVTKVVGFSGRNQFIFLNFLKELVYLGIICAERCKVTLDISCIDAKINRATSTSLNRRRSIGEDDDNFAQAKVVGRP